MRDTIVPSMFGIALALIGLGLSMMYPANYYIGLVVVIVGFILACFCFVPRLCWKTKIELVKKLKPFKKAKDIWFFQGIVSTNDLWIEPECVSLEDFKGEDGENKIESMDLRWQSGDPRPRKIKKDAVIFDIATIDGNNNPVFIGILGVQDMKQSVEPGTYRFTLSLYGKKHNFKIKINPGGGANCIEVIP